MRLHNSLKLVVMQANLKILGRLLEDANKRITEARTYVDSEDVDAVNAAVGTLIGLTGLLEDATAIYRVVLAVHRNKTI